MKRNCHVGKSLHAKLNANKCVIVENTLVIKSVVMAAVVNNVIKYVENH